MQARENLHVVFGEEDNLFRLMEMALLRRPTPEGEKVLAYFFGDGFLPHVNHLTSIADQLSLPDNISVTMPKNEHELDAALPAADVVILETTPFTAARLEACAGRVKHIQQFGKISRHIDIATARRLRLSVANLQRISSLSCADNIVALVLALARNLVQAHNHVLAQRDPALPGVFPTDPPRNKFNWGRIRDIRVLAEHTMGFIGMGENAGLAAGRLRAMGMKVLYYKRSRLSEAEEEQLGGIVYTSRENLLAKSDFVSVHIPYNTENEKYVDAAFISQMKHDAYIINTSRGGILDEAALYEALQSGHLAGAALDVYRYEPVPPDCPLLDLDTIIWTPHISGGRPEFMIRESEDVLRNIARALRGDKPECQLSP